MSDWEKVPRNRTWPLYDVNHSAYADCSSLGFARTVTYYDDTWELCEARADSQIAHVRHTRLPSSGSLIEASGPTSQDGSHDSRVPRFCLSPVAVQGMASNGRYAPSNSAGRRPYQVMPSSGRSRATQALVS